MKTIKDHFKQIEQTRKNSEKQNVFVQALKRKKSQIDEPPNKIIKIVENGETERIDLLRQNLEKLESENKNVIENVERLTNKVADLEKQNEILTHKYSNLKIKYMNVLQSIYTTHVKMMKGKTLQPKTKSTGSHPLSELVVH